MNRVTPLARSGRSPRSPNGAGRRFFNTTHESGATLLDYCRKAESQDEAVLRFFESTAPRNWTPSEVHERIMSDATPITSTRRAISNLTNDGHLVKTESKRMGLFNRPEHAWRYVERTPEQPDLLAA